MTRMRQFEFAAFCVLILLTFFLLTTAVVDALTGGIPFWVPVALIVDGLCLWALGGRYRANRFEDTDAR